MPEAAAILARLDAAIRELQALRAEVVAEADDAKGVNSINTLGDDDLAPEHLLDTHAAQERFGHPRNTIREVGRTEDLGIRRGGRWLVSIPRLQRRLNGK